MAGPAGGKGAEAFGDGSLQFRLIVFHHEQVIAFAIVNGLADFPLTEYGVTGDNSAFKGQFFQEFECGRDFVLAGFHQDVANDRG